MIKRMFPAAACGLGLLIIVFSYAWPRLAGTEKAWTIEQYNQYNETVAELHQASEHPEEAETGSRSAGSPHNDQNQKIEQAKARLDRLNTQLEDARSGRANASRVMKWLGIALVFAGIVVHFAVHHDR